MSLPRSRLQLPDVTLCAVTSVNVEATVSALGRCLSIADFGECLLFTDAPVARADIRVIPIAPLLSASAYSQFLLQELAAYVRTSHVLIVQWDGFLLDPTAWSDKFLNYDYIGAVWPQFQTGGQVGNGGFSLRSKRLLHACLDPAFHASHPEDVAICRENRAWLVERHGVRFADVDVAERFSFERTRPSRPTFGFHGVFNMPEAIGREEFWAIYRSLDERSTIKPDFLPLFAQMIGGKQGLRRAATMLSDRWRGSR
ncbi:hypothetical protein M2337_002732 [Sphingobium sp. B2D3A]|uniref:DUF5672 family protein n=1 Tax=unclassified Sphingobium TaxID=2611147 RepID=UPI00222586F1|nr:MULTISPECIES: DUF5672 family protein [unclassified Sphingobium]MCW2338499.1 hypothetical protein [Sphingobium sp. B2D3A]MCW2384957.1 hypothetical protein [Sphingobium sp. B2D3D]